MANSFKYLKYSQVETLQAYRTKIKIANLCKFLLYGRNLRKQKNACFKLHIFFKTTLGVRTFSEKSLILFER